MEEGMDEWIFCSILNFQIRKKDVLKEIYENFLRICFKEMQILEFILRNVFSLAVLAVLHVFCSGTVRPCLDSGSFPVWTDCYTKLTDRDVGEL